MNLKDSVQFEFGSVIGLLKREMESGPITNLYLNLIRIKQLATECKQTACESSLSSIFGVTDWLSLSIHLKIWHLRISCAVYHKDYLFLQDYLLANRFILLSLGWNAGTTLYINSEYRGITAILLPLGRFGAESVVVSQLLIKQIELDLAFNNVKPKDWYFVLD